MPRADQKYVIPPSLSESNGKPEEFRLGINLYDLQRLDLMFQEQVGKLLVAEHHWVDRNDETDICVPFAPPALKAAMIADVIRSQDRKACDKPTRVYIFRKTWQVLSPSAMLTTVYAGKVLLNPRIFPTEIVVKAEKPRFLKRVKL